MAACWEESHHPDDQELASMAKSNSLSPAGFHQHVHLHTTHMPTGRLGRQHPPWVLEPSPAAFLADQAALDCQS